MFDFAPLQNDTPFVTSKLFLLLAFPMTVA
jgi:hypothetical protein